MRKLLMSAAVCGLCLSGPTFADVPLTPELVHKVCDLAPGEITDIKSLIYCDDLREQAGMKPLHQARPLEMVEPTDTLIDLGSPDYPGLGRHICQLMRCWAHSTHQSCQAQTFVVAGPC